MEARRINPDVTVLGDVAEIPGLGHLPVNAFVLHAEQPVVVDTEAGRQAIEVRGDFEVGRPPGVPMGASLDVPIAVNLPPLPVAPGNRYEWRLTVDGEAREGWGVAFSTMAAPEQV